jgi:tRNA nucleotidyltransferase/poly(A) polymerase
VDKPVSKVKKSGVEYLLSPKKFDESAVQRFISNLEKQHQQDRKTEQQRKQIDQKYDSILTSRKIQLKSSEKQVQTFNLEKKKVIEARTGPDIEGDMGYPPVPQLTAEEQLALDKWTRQTMRAGLKTQIKQKKKPKVAVRYSAVVESMEHENGGKLLVQSKLREER